MPLNLGTITIRQPNRTTITSSDFKPKPNISISEINDVSTIGVEDGKVLTYISANNRYEFIDRVLELDGGLF